MHSHLENKIHLRVDFSARELVWLSLVVFRTRPMKTRVRTSRNTELLVTLPKTRSKQSVNVTVWFIRAKCMSCFFWMAFTIDEPRWPLWCVFCLSSERCSNHPNANFVNLGKNGTRKKSPLAFLLGIVHPINYYFTKSNIQNFHKLTVLVVTVWFPLWSYKWVCWAQFNSCNPSSGTNLLSIWLPLHNIVYWLQMLRRHWLQY